MIGTTRHEDHEVHKDHEGVAECAAGAISLGQPCACPARYRSHGFFVTFVVLVVFVVKTALAPVLTHQDWVQRSRSTGAPQAAAPLR